MKVLEYKTGETAGVPYIISVTEDIDLKTVGTANLFTVPAGKKAIITGAIITPTNISGFVAPPVLGIGIAPNEDDIFSYASLTGLDSINKVYNFCASATYVVANAGNVIKLGIDTGANAADYTGNVSLIGFLVDA